jgi:glutamate racemase
VVSTPSPQQDAPIGVFDSGVGGLSVWREIVAQLPHENTLYLADQAHIPYGPRSQEEIRRFSVAIADFLIGQGAKAIVVACNTASGAALQSLREQFPTHPFIGMEPAVKPAAERTLTGAVGVLATPTTFQGDLFRRLVDRFGRDVAIHTGICPGLVEAVESGELESPQTRDLLVGCLDPMVSYNIDQLVLGCTHYPFLEFLIRDIVGPSITLIDPAPAVARQVERVLQQTGVLNPASGRPSHRFCTTGDHGHMSRMVSRLVRRTPNIEQVFWSNGRIRIGGC